MQRDFIDVVVDIEPDGKDSGEIGLLRRVRLCSGIRNCVAISIGGNKEEGKSVGLSVHAKIKFRRDSAEGANVGAVEVDAIVITGSTIVDQAKVRIGPADDGRGSSTEIDQGEVGFRG